MVNLIESTAIQVRIDMIEQALRHEEDLPAIRVLILCGEWVGLKKAIGEHHETLGSLLNRFRKEK
jgi:hypothetical protein